MKRPLCMVCLAFILSVFLILEYGSPPTDEFSESVGEKKIVTGLVYAKEFSNDKLVIYLKNVTVSNIQLQNFPKTNQKIICYVEKLQVVKLGSFIQLRGTVNLFDKATNPGGFDARLYYATLGIGAKLEKAVILNQTDTYSKKLEFLYELKVKLSQICDGIFDSTKSSVMKAMLLGEKKEMDRDTKSLYQKSGISHILAISGLHISIIGMGLYQILKKLKVPLIVRILLAIVVMYHYGLMIGMGSSAYRAIFMFAVKLSANLVKRTYDMITALTISAILLLLEQPLYVYNSGFLLSFGAILAIGLFQPVVEQLYCGMKKKMFYKWFLSPFIITLSVSLVTLPILLMSFYEFAPYSLIINLLVIPLSPFLLGLGLLSFVLYLISPFLAGVAGLPCIWILEFYEWLCKLNLELPGSTWNIGRPAQIQSILYYLVLILLAVAYKRLHKMTIMVSIICSVFILVTQTDNRMAITMLDVGQGESILIQSPAGIHYLIDGGSTSQSKVGEYVLLPALKYYGIGQLDFVFVTHTDKDHISGISELIEDMESTGIEIKTLILPYIEKPDESYCKLVELAKNNNIQVILMQGGDFIKDGYISFNCIHPQKDYMATDRNAHSLVLELEYSSFRALFTGDISSKEEELLIDNLTGDYQILKAAHHGSTYSNTEEFLETVNPQIVLISCGENNSYGHPGERVIDLLKEKDIDTFITMEMGAIEIRIQNKKEFYVYIYAK